MTGLLLERYNELLPGDLHERARAARRGYADADPFPHAVLEDVVPSDLLREVAREFGDCPDADWKSYDKPSEVKLELDDEARLGPHTRALLHNLNASPFLRFLETVTGIDNLIPDPHLSYGGLHRIERGGKLGIHADFNKNVHWQLDRRVNVLLYLNEDWDDAWGGHLELWDRRMERCAQRIAPSFNRMVVFSTDSTSYHGHPDPLACPPDRARRSIALYYYTNGRPDGEGAEQHGTLFQRRPGERHRWTFVQIVKQLVPPILVSAARRVLG